MQTTSRMRHRGTATLTNSFWLKVPVLYAMIVGGQPAGLNHIRKSRLRAMTIIPAMSA